MHPAIARRIVHVAGLGGRDRASSERPENKEQGDYVFGSAPVAEVPSRARRGDTVLEVGPGKGMLTRALLDAGARVIAVEADAALVEGLQTRFAHEIAEGHLELIHGDIRTVGYQKFLTTVTNFGYRVVANIPYYITGEIIRLFLESEHQPRSMTLLVQKEVAERIARAKKETLLSLSVKAYGEPHYEFTVPRGAFVPAPKVDSAVLSIRDISRKHFASSADEERFFALIHAGFAHKRKYLRGNLAAAGLPVPAGLPSAGVPEKARAEDLALADWLALVRSGDMR
ncbi:MAG: rRNA adenine dimethyltransferase family protein [bacterium]|nr:rRNA adenine dimethyltransferase family protein [bacterium]